MRGAAVRHKTHLRVNPLPVGKKKRAKKAKKRKAPVRRRKAPKVKAVRKNPTAKRYLIEAYKNGTKYSAPCFYYLTPAGELRGDQKSAAIYSGERAAHKAAVALRKSLADRPRAIFDWVRARPA